MKREQHIEHCRQTLGMGFPQVHDYLDQYADKIGPEHRAILHNVSGVTHCYMEWGSLAGAAACLHIWADEVGLIQKEDGTFERASSIGELFKTINEAGLYE